MSSPGEWYAELPPISKLFGTVCVLTTVGVQFQLVNPMLLVLDWGSVLYKFQIWRLVTNFVFLGGFGLPFAIRLMMIARYGVYLEKTTYEGRTADFAFMLVFAMITLLLCSLLIPFMRMAIYSSTLVFMLVYIWSRNNPDQSVSLMGVLKLKAFWMPWALMAFTMVMGGNPLPDLFGIFVGHLYYFLTAIHPRAGGADLIRTPEFFRRFIDQTYGGFGYVNPNYRAPPAAPRAFQGRGRRLGDD
uniref:Derlin n=1 Tax=Pyramimonas obovata TaxID=1411642 RepID=A0A7S0QTM2_9CHLO|eukprot:CAMPEP_0118934712 /NCGR_PEP_ID=MMETSP1169-20130426/13975_1 /TAXON_ID=36882 /ORGANISM="Pyramimonas obovata, Strain CCMP722" /LENGTH=243 /DNA_ID=CAMNT_0006877641 /DNA_START=32 /DNA_END=763 /DNA_ORIENTATION=-